MNWRHNNIADIAYIGEAITEVLEDYVDKLYRSLVDISEENKDEYYCHYCGQKCDEDNIDEDEEDEEDDLLYLATETVWLEAAPFLEPIMKCGLS